MVTEGQMSVALLPAVLVPSSFVIITAALVVASAIGFKYKKNKKAQVHADNSDPESIQENENKDKTALVKSSEGDKRLPDPRSGIGSGDPELNSKAHSSSNRNMSDLGKHIITKDRKIHRLKK